LDDFEEIFNKETLAKFRADSDQMMAAFKEVAKGNRIYYEELVEQGFSHEDAMDLLKTLILSLFSKGYEDE
jgi:DNA polymerase III delta prime subunit